ncbi:MAG: membrane lipoprotein lipid attachment site-containing protein [Defluviitaleaceae bacterium]|nr:membrane lipoprotein lipid attachment site-containing protein [Defluviitaleaceae bacterium]
MKKIFFVLFGIFALTACSVMEEMSTPIGIISNASEEADELIENDEDLTAQINEMLHSVFITTSEPFIFGTWQSASRISKIYIDFGDALDNVHIATHDDIHITAVDDVGSHRHQLSHNFAEETLWFSINPRNNSEAAYTLYLYIPMHWNAEEIEIFITTNGEIIADESFNITIQS